jgi:PAS domain S-box-containing protein
VTDRELLNLREAQQIAGVGNWEWLPDTDRQQWSRELSRIFGRDPSLPPPSPEDFLTYLHPDERPRARECLDRTLKTGAPFRIDVRIVRSDGETRTVDLRGRLSQGDDGGPSRLIGAAQDITERKQAEEALRQSEEQSRVLFEHQIIAMAMTSPEKGIVRVNDQFCRLLGYSREELAHMTWRDITHPDDLADSVIQFNRVMAGEIDSYSLEKRYVRKDGEIVYGHASLGCVRNSDGSMAYLLALLSDVTERKKAEEALRKSEEAYRGLFELSPDAIVVWGSDGIFGAANKAAATLLGLDKPEDIVGRRWPDFVAQEDRAARAETLQTVEKGGGVNESEFRLQRKDGSRVFVQSRVRATLDGAGNLAQTVAMVRDITARKQAEEATYLSEARFRSIFEAAGHGMALLDLDGRFLKVNAAFCRIIGYSEDEMRVRTFLDITHPEDMAESLTTAQRMGAGEMSNLELVKRYVRKDGGIVWVQLNVSVVHDAAGAPVYRICQVQDITGRKRAEEELRAYRQHLEELVALRTSDLAKTNEELQAVNQELETFSYSVSHDLRTPLRAIDGFSRILLEDYSRKLKPEGRRMLNVVHDNTVRMGRLIDDILAFSRLSRGEMSSALIDMDRSVRTVLEEMAPVFAGRKLRFDIKPLATAQGDGAMIKRVWTNLIDNAVKFTGGKPDSVIEIGSTEGGKDTIYYVRDGGVGFDMQYVDKLFGVFQRLHSSEFDGTGIGLAIIKRVIARHGGRVWAEGKVNEGATLYFTLPTSERADA